MQHSGKSHGLPRGHSNAPSAPGGPTRDAPPGREGPRSEGTEKERIICKPVGQRGIARHGTERHSAAAPHRDPQHPPELLPAGEAHGAPDAACSRSSLPSLQSAERRSKRRSLHDGAARGGGARRCAVRLRGGALRVRAALGTERRRSPSEGVPHGGSTRGGRQSPKHRPRCRGEPGRAVRASSGGERIPRGSSSGAAPAGAEGGGAPRPSELPGGAAGCYLLTQSEGGAEPSARPAPPGPAPLPGAPSRRSAGSGLSAAPHRRGSPGPSVGSALRPRPSRSLPSGSPRPAAAAAEGSGRADVRGLEFSCYSALTSLRGE